MSSLKFDSSWKIVRRLQCGGGVRASIEIVEKEGVTALRKHFEETPYLFRIVKWMGRRLQ